MSRMRRVNLNRNKSKAHHRMEARPKSRSTLKLQARPHEAMIKKNPAKMMKRSKKNNRVTKSSSNSKEIL